jgi:hypothetical protein
MRLKKLLNLLMLGFVIYKGFADFDHLFPEGRIFEVPD